VNRNDKLFIFIAAILVILFIAGIAENIFSFSSTQPAADSPKGHQDEHKIAEILTRLQEAGLSAHEAKYYEGLSD